ncbi:hypothetical protein FOZ62_003967, partial [Perkinsus olseni]
MHVGYSKISDISHSSITDMLWGLLVLMSMIFYFSLNRRSSSGNVDGSDNNVLASAQRGGCYDETVTSTTTSPNGSDDNIIMTTTNDDGEDGIIPESVYPVLENVIASVELGINGRHSDDGHDHDGSGLIDLKKVAFKARNAEYNPR